MCYNFKSPPKMVISGLCQCFRPSRAKTALHYWLMKESHSFFPSPSTSPHMLLIFNFFLHCLPLCEKRHWQGRQKEISLTPPSLPYIHQWTTHLENKAVSHNTTWPLQFIGTMWTLKSLSWTLQIPELSIFNWTPHVPKWFDFI